MEEIMGQSMRPPINFKNFLKKYKQSIEDFESEFKRKLPSENSTRWKRAEENCALTNISHDEDNRIFKYEPGYTDNTRRNVANIPCKALKLKTFKRFLSAKESSERNPFLRSTETYKRGYIPSKIIEGKLCNLGNELLISVRVYRPARATHIGKTIERPVFREEFLCLGSNLLSELKDRISCDCNKYHFFDISNDPDMKLPEKTLDPGFFFITDTFYNDHRNSGNIDYSEVIRNWAKQAVGLKNLEFKVADMHTTEFIDLTVSLGFPQLYQHHGNCEHVFTFSQISILTDRDEVIERKYYPFLRSFGVYNNRLCNLCGLMHYSIIVSESDRQLHDPSYLCEKCFKSFHYIDGKKIGEFKAYRIHGNSNKDSTEENGTESEKNET